MTNDNSLVSVSKQVKGLGVILDSSLSFEAHINNVTNFRNKLTQIDYCNSLFYVLASKSSHKLQLVHNATMLIISKTSTSKHISPVLQNLHWLPVKYKVNIQILLLTYKALNNPFPSYLSDHLCINTPKRILWSASALTCVHLYIFYWIMSFRLCCSVYGIHYWWIFVIVKVL